MNRVEILNSYLISALWTAELDSYGLDDIDLDSKKKAIADIDLFIQKGGELLDNIPSEQIGHDFWLTRNGHGTGFWDRGYGEVGDKLTAICKEFRELNVFDMGIMVFIE